MFLLKELLEVLKIQADLTPEHLWAHKGMHITEDSGPAPWGGRGDLGHQGLRLGASLAPKEGTVARRTLVQTCHMWERPPCAVVLH